MYGATTSLLRAVRKKTPTGPARPPPSRRVTIKRYTVACTSKRVRKFVFRTGFRPRRRTCCVRISRFAVIAVFALQSKIPVGSGSSVEYASSKGVLVGQVFRDYWFGRTARNNIVTGQRRGGKKPNVSNRSRARSCR